VISDPRPRAENLPRVARTPFYYGWVILVIASLASFTSAPGQTYTFAVFQDSFIEGLGVSSTTISALYLLGSLTAAGSVIFIGRGLDRFGPRIMLVIAALALGLGAIWLSRVDGAWQLYVGFAIMRSFGQGALQLIPSTLVSIWFVRRRAMALALMALGGSIAGGTFPLYADALIDGVGWRSAWIAIAITTWGLLIIPAVIFVRSSPESVGLLPDGDAVAGDEGGEDNATPSGYERTWTVSQAMRTRALWLLIFAGSAQSLVGTGVMFQQVSIMTSKGLSTSVAAGVFAVFAPTAISGQFLSGYLASRVKARYLLAAGQGGIVVAMLLLLSASELWQAYLYGAVLGITMGFLMNTNQAIWPVYFGRRNLGSIRGVTNFGMMTAAAFGPLPLALALDITGSYTPGLVAYMILPPLCGLAALMAGNPQRGTEASHGGAAARAA